MPTVPFRRPMTGLIFRPSRFPPARFLPRGAVQYAKAFAELASKCTATSSSWSMTARPWDGSASSRRAGQQAVEEAIERVRRPVGGGAPRAGRTDAGVHATRPSGTRRSRWRLADAIRCVMLQNAHLRRSVLRALAHVVPDNFHARFSATKRHYLYRPDGGRLPPSTQAASGRCRGARCRARCTRQRNTSLGVMISPTFRAAECQANSPVRTLDWLDVERIGRDELRSAPRRAESSPSGAFDGRELVRAGAGGRASTMSRRARCARSQTLSVDGPRRVELSRRRRIRSSSEPRA